MNPADVAPMVIGLALIMTTGGVILLRPIFKKLGDYLEVLSEERRRALEPRAPQVDARMVNVLESLEKRLARVEEQQAFTDQLLTSGKRPEEHQR